MISVIIPTYNRAAFLDKAIRSVLNQTFKEFELIIVDDGSTDNTSELVSSFDGVHYIWQENKGAASARNTGIRAARFDHLTFLDSDDWFVKNKLEMQFAAMQAAPQYLVSHTQEKWYRRGAFLNQKKKHAKNHGYIFERCLELCAVGMSTIMVRRELFDQVGMFDESLPCCEDYDLWLRASVRFQFLLVDHALTCKDGGRPDQLSVQYRVGMDKFRIDSMQKIIDSGALDSEQRQLAVAELSQKCKIYGTGCIKHNRKEEGVFYLDLPQKYTSSL